MMQVKTAVNTTEEQLAALYQMMQANKDEENAEKLLDLFYKLQDEELIVSFSGHFSAGKSSMINTLLGKEILPKSPIPTSANIVKLTSGGGYARVFFTGGEPVEYREPYDLEMIKAYSKNKDTIKGIEISTADDIIPQGRAVMDTPGIDAADDADRLMTESALHLVDLMFYVMDYNHVQSEVNLYFLQSLQENNIPFYLIINQIDKHNENELSFASFKESIRQTYANWGIEPEDVFYTSLYDESLEINEFPAVRETLFSILTNESNAYLNIDASVQQVMRKHQQFLEDQYEDLKQEIAVNEELESQLSDIEILEDKMNQLAHEPKELEEAFLRELNQTLQNAYLMPKDLRDKAEKYLISREPGFKIGLFGSKKKTEEEKTARQEDFETSLHAVIESSVKWKLRDKFIQLMRDYQITDQTLIERVNDFKAAYTAENFEKLLKPGAKVNGDYVLHYTNDVASDVKAVYKRQALRLLESIKQALEEKHASILNEHELSYQNIKEAEEIQKKYEKIEEELAEKQQAVEAMLASPVVNRDAWEATLFSRSKKQNNFLKGENIVVATEKTQQVSETIPEEERPLAAGTTAEDMLSRIEETIRLTEELPGFDDLLADLEVKKDRLSNRTFTIALFGAFSAGKSSFSNALLGERILPVSPNPTTAAVNRIHPVSMEHPDGTVVVTMKSEEELMKEFHAMTDKFSPKGENFERLLQWAEKKKITEHEHLNNMYQAYIQALLKGYPVNKEHIGGTKRITIDDFKTYVTDETIACYIETIDVYYDSPVTRQGITLVDTPGADSVNARHTNVAFNYIKHADAILYVTYYNHALSRADRDFLMQLGRVKEAFQMDKMFFIINAADLAESEEELDLVTSYVKDELLKLGIRQARLFPVSSKQSLEEKLDQKPLNEQMKRLENSFYTFIHQDLASLTIESARWDIKRVYETMKHYMDSMTMGTEEKEKQKEQLKQDKQQALTNVTAYETAVYVQQIKQRIEKQLFYVTERLGIRYHDMFKEMFNPTTITENGRKAQGQLKNALDNLLEYIRFELTQELQAVSLRLEGYTLEIAHEVYRDIQERNKRINNLFTLPNQFSYEFDTPAYDEAFETDSKKAFQSVLGKYKGTKAFFVQNEKEVMKEDLFTLILPHAEAFIQKNQVRMEAGYLRQWEELIDLMKDDANSRLEKQTANYLSMLETPANLSKLEANVEKMEALAKE